MKSNSQLTLLSENYLPARATIIMAGILFFSAVLVYGNSLLNGFVWDDQRIIVDNLSNRDFSNFSKVFFSPDSTSEDHQTFYYRPLNRLTYLLEYWLYGLQPFSYHLVNVLIHAGNAILLFFLSLRFFCTPIAAFATSLFFVIHPINTEAVNFVSGRNNGLATLFILLVVLLFQHGESKDQWRYYILAGLALLGGLLTKEIALMTPMLLLLAPCFNKEHSWLDLLRRRMLALIPCAAAIFCYLALRMMVLPAIVDSTSEFSLGQRIFQNLYIIPKYLSLIAYPQDLNILHYASNYYAASLYFLVSFWLCLFIAVWLMLRFGGAVVYFGLLWFGVNYIPISQIIPFSSSPIAERYLYLPAIGLWFLIGCFIEKVYVRNRLRPFLWTSLGILIFILSVLTWKRNSDWRDDLSLFRASVQVDESSITGHYNLGVNLYNRGDLGRARIHFLRTIELNPNHSFSLVNLGNIAWKQNQFTGAETYYRQALIADPTNPYVLYNLGMVMEGKGRLSEAIRYYELYVASAPVESRPSVTEVSKLIYVLRQRKQ